MKLLLIYVTVRKESGLLYLVSQFMRESVNCIPLVINTEEYEILMFCKLHM